MQRIVGIVFAAAIVSSACGGTSNAPTTPTKPSEPAAAASSGPGDTGTQGSPAPNSSNSVEIRGAIDTVTGTASAFQFKIGSRVIRGDALTSFTAHGRSDSFSSLKEGLTVEIKGEQRTDFIFATRVNIEDDEPDADDNDDNDDDDDVDDDDDDDNEEPNPPQAASVHGTLTSIAGTAPALLLNVGSTIVHTSASTTVKRKGDELPFSVLRAGQELHVVGTRQADASIDARKIEIEDEDDAEFRAEGSIGPVTGTCPAIQFSLGSTTIVTNALTRFDNLSCGSLASGARVEVRGLSQPSGTVTATRVKRK